MSVLLDTERMHAHSVFIIHVMVFRFSVVFSFIVLITSHIYGPKWTAVTTFVNII